MSDSIKKYEELVEDGKIIPNSTQSNTSIKDDMLTKIGQIGYELMMLDLDSNETIGIATRLSELTELINKVA